MRAIRQETNMNNACFSQQGMTLIEVMIALLILAIGLLGVAALQSQGQQHTAAAQVRTHATVLANSFIDRVRINRIVANNGGYGDFSSTTRPAAANCRTNSCTTTLLRNFDVNEWLDQVENTLPAGRGTIAYSTTLNRYTITIFWALRESETERDSAGNIIATEKSMTWVMSP
jgi:type IV pilus assembly protein PilV